MKRQGAWLLAGVPFVMVLGNSMLIPVLPSLKKALGMSTFQTGLVISLFSLAAGLSIPWAGLLADRVGRRRVLLPALALYALGGLGAGFSCFLSSALAPILLLLSRAVQGVGAAGTAPVAMVMVGDLFQGGKRSRALGIFEASNGLGKILSPLLGAAAGLLGFFWPFFLFPCFVFPLLVLLWWLVPEPESRPKAVSSQTYWEILKSIGRQKGVWLASIFLAGLTTLLTLFGFLFFLSEHFETAWRIKGLLKGTLLALPTGCTCLAAFLTGKLIKPRSRLPRLFALSGMFLMALFFAGLIFFQQFWPLVALSGLAGIGAGATLTSLNTLATSSAGPQARGLVTSLYGGVRFLGAASGPSLFSLLVPHSLPLTFGLTAALCLLSALVLFLVKPEATGPHP
ncbi:major facilitator superfamily MFS_1 [Ammonifex degensii KC4]|uniref:Major facilitator superfamily MFS_1 n=1 Tax=Ammonifex degensii (strain DSM 10501 / KC4) TaxID=429009 RepID=C9R8R8_AMMDK|nr:MFS transporter [Ammonifex degensii]ACX52697.1 major facilitator superfamily MFS_1 [Ammonifex degensii KC4]